MTDRDDAMVDPMEFHPLTADERAEIAALLAGDCDDDAVQARVRALAATPAGRREADFWRCLRTSLSAPVPAPVVDETLAGRLLQRRDWQVQSGQLARRRSVMRWVPATLAAAMLLATGLALGHWSAASTVATPFTLAWFEDGSPALVRQPGVDDLRADTTMPLARLAAVTVRAGDPIVAVDRVQRAWLGIWTKPVQMHTVDGKQSGHLIVRIAGGSPAAEAGLQPGDVIVDIANCPVMTPSCVANALHGSRPGDLVPVRFWNGRSGTLEKLEIVLGLILE